LELQPTGSVDLGGGLLLKKKGMEVDGWKIKVVVEWKWMWRISLWVIKGLGLNLTNLLELWNGDSQVSRLLGRMHPLFCSSQLNKLQPEQFARAFPPPVRSMPSTHFPFTNIAALLGSCTRICDPVPHLDPA